MIARRITSKDCLSLLARLPVYGARSALQPFGCGFKTVMPQKDAHLASLMASTEADSLHMWSSTSDLLHGVLAGDRSCLARAITLVESSRDDHRRQAELLLDSVLLARSPLAQSASSRRAVPLARPGHSGSASSSPSAEEVEVDDTGHPLSSVPFVPGAIPPTFRIGIAGPPGAGKSSLIEALGLHALAQGHRVAVVAVDPSSSRTGGSILGDKTRMPLLSRHPDAYVRPSPTRGALGGLAEHTNDVILLTEGAGFDVVLVETVGLGQSEVAIDSAVDMLLLVVAPAGGDELQGVKKGIVEVADAVIVNKADPGSPLSSSAAHAQSDYRRALQLVRWKHQLPAGVWVPATARCSALTGWGVPDVWDLCARFRRRVGGAGVISLRRKAQASEWMWNGLAAQLTSAARGCTAVTDAAQTLASDLAAGSLTPRRAAHELLRTFLTTAAASAGG